MTALIIEGTEDTPRVEFIPETGIYMLSGRSLPEDVMTFYQPVFEWLDGFAIHGGSQIQLQIKLEYFNTASSKVILDILMKLEEMLSEGKDVSVSWHYADSDTDMLEAGEEYADLVRVPFEMLKY
jgi:hypothetical protein